MSFREKGSYLIGAPEFIMGSLVLTVFLLLAQPAMQAAFTAGSSETICEGTL